jgi:hypothetical protein
MRKGWYAQYAHVLAVARSLGKVPFEFPAIVGLPDQIAQGNAATVQQLLDARSEDSAVRGAAFSAKAQNDSPLRGAERAQLLTQSQDPLRRSLQRVTARRAAMLLRTRVAVLLVAPPPPADCERAGGDQPGSDLPPPLLA